MRTSSSRCSHHRLSGGPVEIDRRQFIEVASGAAAVLPLHAHDRAVGTDDPLGVRRDFPVVGEGLYLNSAYIAPVPLPVAAAARALCGREANKTIRLRQSLEATDEVRRQF